ncbi:hypothetical protein BGZ97_002508, partial [Linnemannia gamsii]
MDPLAGTTGASGPNSSSSTASSGPISLTSNSIPISSTNAININNNNSNNNNSPPQSSSAPHVPGAHSIAAAQPHSSLPKMDRSEMRKAKAVSDAIDKALRADKERLQKERSAKLLIL